MIELENECKLTKINENLIVNNGKIEHLTKLDIDNKIHYEELEGDFWVTFYKFYMYEPHLYFVINLLSYSHALQDRDGYLTEYFINAYNTEIDKINNIIDKFNKDTVYQNMYRTYTNM